MYFDCCRCLSFSAGLFVVYIMNYDTTYGRPSNSSSSWSWLNGKATLSRLLAPSSGEWWSDHRREWKITNPVNCKPRRPSACMHAAIMHANQTHARKSNTCMHALQCNAITQHPRFARTAVRCWMVTYIISYHINQCLLLLLYFQLLFQCFLGQRRRKSNSKVRPDTTTLLLYCCTSDAAFINSFYSQHCCGRLKSTRNTKLHMYSSVIYCCCVLVSRDLLLSLCTAVQAAVVVLAALTTVQQHRSDHHAHACLHAIMILRYSSSSTE